MAITGINLTDVAQGDSISRVEWQNGSTISGKLEGYDPLTDSVNDGDITLAVTEELTPNGTVVASPTLQNINVNDDGTFTAEMVLPDGLDEDYNYWWGDKEDGFLWFEATYNNGTTSTSDDLVSAKKSVLFDPDTYPGYVEFDHTNGTSEESTQVLEGNVIDGNNAADIYSGNNPHQNNVDDTLIVSPSSVKYVGATEELGELTMLANGDYTYTLDNDKAQHLSQGEMGGDNYTFDMYDAAGNKYTQSLRIAVVGENDKPCICDVEFAGLEGDITHLTGSDLDNYMDGNTDASTDGKVDDETGWATVFQGQLEVQDIDVHDGYKFTLLGGTPASYGHNHVIEDLDITSDYVDPALLAGSRLHYSEDTGRIQLDGNFDALGEGETATVTFKYQVTDYYDQNGNGVMDGTETASSTSEFATATITVTGTNDAIQANPDQIFTFRDLPTGNIYDAVLRNDTDLDVNDQKYIYSTTQPFGFGGSRHGSVALDTDSEFLRYSPQHGDDPFGTGGMYGSNFTYQVSDREDHTDLSATNSGSLVHIDVLSANINEKIENYMDESDACEDNEYCGTADNDLISAGAGNDKIWGKSGHDILYGGAGQDEISGGKGKDVLYGGKDADILRGGKGKDIFAFNSGDGADIIQDYTDEDMIALGTTINSEDIAFFLDDCGTADTSDDQLKIQYSDDCNDIITVEGTDLDDANVVYDTAGGILVDINVNAVIGAINAYNADPAHTAVNNVCEVQNNDELMTLISAAGGYAGV